MRTREDRVCVRGKYAYAKYEGSFFFGVGWFGNAHERVICRERGVGLSCAVHVGYNVPDHPIR